MNDSPFAPRPHTPPSDGIVRAAPPAYPDPYAPVPYGANYGSYGTEATPEAGSGVAGLRRLGAMLARRRLIIVATLLSVLVATFLFSRTRVALYQSQTTLAITTAPRSSSGPAGSDDTTEALDAYTRSAGTRSLETQLAILNSPEIQLAAIKLLPPAERGAVTDAGAMAHETTTDLIDINATATQPKAALDMANAMATTYIQHTLNANRQSYATATVFAKQQRDIVGAKLKTATAKLREFQQLNNYIDPSQTSTLLTKQTSLQSALADAARDRQETEAKLADARRQIAGMSRGSYQSQSIVQRPEYAAIRSKLTELNLELADKSAEYQPDSPEIQSLKSQIRDLEQQLAAQSKQESGGLVFVANPVYAQLQQQISQLDNQLKAIVARQSVLSGQAADAGSQVKQLPRLQQQLAQLQGAVTTLSRNYQALNDRYNSYLLNQGVRPPDAQSLFPNGAQAPVSLAGSTKRNMIMGGLLGLVLALVLAALVDWMDDRVHSEEEAKNALHLPVLAQVPMARDGSATLAPSQNAALPSPSLENFRMLRTLVAFSPLQTPARSVLLTSSLPGEGKSVCAANLAIAAALSGERVILVDGDLRRPTQHEIFGTPNDIGFSSVANGHCTLREALQDTNTPGLRLLPGGPVEANPFTLLNGPRGRQALREAGELADLVIIDSPPALLFADAQLLASESDAVLLVVSSRDAGKREISRTRALLAQSGVRPVGIILNKLGGEAESYDKYTAKYYGRYRQPINKNGNGNNGTSRSRNGSGASASPTTNSMNGSAEASGQNIATTGSATAVAAAPTVIGSPTTSASTQNADTPFDSTRFTALRDLPHDEVERGDISREDGPERA